MLLTRVRGEESGLRAIYRGFYLSAFIGAALTAVAAFAYLPSTFAALSGISTDLADHTGDPRVVATLAVVIGVLLAGIILWLTGYFTGTTSNPTIHVARTTQTGAATVVLSGIGVGFESAVYTAGIIAAAICAVFLISGGSIALSLFLIALAGCGLLTTVGVIVAMDTFGPVSDNAQGIAEMSGDVDERGAKILTDLDAVGNTTKAITKGIAIATAVLAATALFGSYTDAVQHAVESIGGAAQTAGLSLAMLSYQVISPITLVGVILGGATVFLFSGLAIDAVDPGRRRDRVRGPPPVPRDAGDHDRRDQARLRPGRRHLHAGLAAGAGHARPARGVRADRGRLRPRRRAAGRVPRRCDRHGRADGGVPGQLRRRVGQREEDRRGRPLRWEELRRRTPRRVIGDTVGDPFKDTAGPAINPLIKVMNLVALLIAPAVVHLASATAPTTRSGCHRDRRDAHRVRRGHRLPGARREGGPRGCGSSARSRLAETRRSCDDVRSAATAAAPGRLDGGRRSRVT